MAGRGEGAAGARAGATSKPAPSLGRSLRRRDEAGPTRWREQGPVWGEAAEGVAVSLGTAAEGACSTLKFTLFQE